LQKTLAKEITILVHSEKDYNSAVDASEILFGNSTTETLMALEEKTFLDIFDGVPMYEIGKDVFKEQVKTIDLLTDKAKVFESKSEFRRLVTGGGISINRKKVEDPDGMITQNDLINDKYMLIQKGKKNYHLITIK
jgi:tyrosyl-tRNA synthetase